MLEDVEEEWPHRPLDELYAIVYLDALVVKVKTDRSVLKESTKDSAIALSVASPTKPTKPGRRGG